MKKEKKPCYSVLAMCMLFSTILCMPAYALEISKVEINQAIGVQKDGHYNFVAGKDTAVIAYLSEDTAIDQSNSSAKIFRDGNLVATLSPRSYDKPVKTVEFLCPNREGCGNWAAGTYRFEVIVNGIQKNEPAEGASYSYVFVERKQLRILAIPVKTNYNGVITQVQDDKWKTMHTFTSSVYPVAADKVKWETRGEFDASANKFNLETDDGQRNLWEALTNLMPTTCSTDPNGEGCYDLIVGFISDRPETYPQGNLQGFTYGRPTNIVVAKDEDAPATVAHEIAHVYGIGDTYNGGAFRCSVNPAPDAFTGKNWDNFEQMTSCSSGRIALDQISATKIPAELHPYEIGGRGHLGDMACYMGSGGLQSQFWTSAETYDHLFEQLAPVAIPRKNPKATSQRFINFLGYINEAGNVEIEPWETFNDSSDFQDSEGTYTLLAVDTDDNILSSKKLDISFYILNTPPQPIEKIDWAPFKGAMPFPSNTARFYVLKNGEVMGTIPVSANTPLVANVTPTSTSSISGEYTVKWSASDADNDQMSFKVEYNPDTTNPNSPWMVLTADAGTTSWNENFAELPGGNHAKIRITATDWVLSSMSESAEFSVPFKAPEIYIEDPEWGDSYEEGDEVFLEAEIFDLQDEKIPDSDIKWKSNIDGDLGTGNNLITDKLSMGEHTITLTASNSRGLSKSETINLKVGNISYSFIEYVASGGTDTLLSNNFKNLKTVVKVPDKASDKDLFVMFESLSQPSSSTTPQDFAFTGRYFGLSAEKLINDEWTETESLMKPVSVTIDYSKDLPSDIDESTLKIYRFDNITKAWNDIEKDAASGQTVYDRSKTGKISAEVNKLGEFALVGNKKASSSSNNCFISSIEIRKQAYTTLIFVSAAFYLALILFNRRASKIKAETQSAQKKIRSDCAD